MDFKGYSESTAGVVRHLTFPAMPGEVNAPARDCQVAVVDTVPAIVEECYVGSSVERGLARVFSADSMLVDDMLRACTTDQERAKRSDLAKRRPYVAAKLAANKARQEQGFATPIIRLASNFLCNFQCQHC